MTVASSLLESEEHTHRVRRRNLQRTVLASVLADIQFWMIQPLVALTLATQGHSPAGIGLVASAPWFVVAVTAPAIPWLVSRFGLVGVLRLSIVLSALAVGSFACFDQLAVWIAANAVLGLGFGLCWVVSDSWVSAAALEGARGRVLGLYETIASSTVGFGALLLTFVVAFDAPPFVFAGVLLILSAATTLGLTTDQCLVASRLRMRSLFKTITRSPAIILFAFLCGLLEEGGVALLPVYALGIGFDAKLAALSVTAFGLGHLFLQYPIGVCCDKLGQNVVQSAIMCLLFLGFVAAPLFGMNGPALLTLLLVLGGLIGALYTTCMVEAGNVLRGSSLVGAVTAMMAVNTLGCMMGPTFAGIAMGVSPEYGMFAVFAVAVVGTALCIVLLRPRASDLETHGDLALQAE